MNDILLLLPFATLIVLNLLPRSTRSAAWIPCLVIFGLQTAFAAAWPFVPHDWTALEPLETWMGISLTVDGLSVLLMGAAGLAGCAALILSSGRAATPQTRFSFCNLFLVALAGMNGISMARDLFTLYVFIEVTSVAAFILVSVRGTKQGFEGAWKYLIMSAVASVFMLVALAFFLLGAGGVTFAETAAALAAPTPLVWVATALFLCGLFVKGAMVPFHGWLADAYTEAPPAVAVFLAGILTKASGIYALMRLVPLLPPATGPIHFIVLIAGTVTAVVGAFLALTQSDMKRMLAWSSLSQMGYIVMALGGEPALALAAAGLHFFNHTVSKAQLFANAAAVEEQLNTRDMDRMGGLGTRMPLTAGTSAVATLSISGLPPLAGFWSKLLIVIGLWRAGQVVFAVIAILTSLVTLAYFLSLQRRAFFGKIAAEWETVREAGPGFMVPAIVLAAITVLVGIGFPLLLPVILGGGV
ncbi:MAG TPA: proton-conducting transporter membrane subunit [Spirochaetia bacterium]